VHQPREGLFDLFDQFVLLAAGRLLYRGGGGADALRYFSTRGHSLPPRTNPADFLIDLACVDTREAGAEAATRATVAALTEAYAGSEEAAAGAAEAAAEVASGGLGGMERPTPRLAVTLPLLLRRSWANLSRQPGVLASRIMQPLAFGAILACFYTRLGLDEEHSIQNRMGLLYEMMALVFVGMLNCIAVFPPERNLFYRECSDGAVSAPAFMLSYTLLELPCELLAALVFAIMMCPISGLQSDAAHFFRVAYVTFCIVNCGESVGIAFCGLIYHVGFSVTLVSIFLSFWTIMAGFFQPEMPQWLQVVNYGSVLKYAGNTLAVSEFTGLTFSCAQPPCARPDGETVLSIYRFHPSDLTSSLWAMAACVVLYRLAAFALLSGLKHRHL